MRIAAAIGGLLLLTQIVLLSIQLATLKQSNAHILSQDAKQSRLYPLQKASAENAVPVLRDARGMIKPLGRQARRVASATDNLVGLIQQMADDVHMSRQMQGHMLDLLQRSLDLQAQSRDLQVQSRDLQVQSRDIQQASLSIQRETLSIQKQALAILQQSKGIQAETLQHARNIDNKTGGGLTTP